MRSFRGLWEGLRRPVGEAAGGQDPQVHPLGAPWCTSDQDVPGGVCSLCLPSLVTATRPWGGGVCLPLEGPRVKPQRGPDTATGTCRGLTLQGPELKAAEPPFL